MSVDNSGAKSDQSPPPPARPLVHSKLCFVCAATGRDYTTFCADCECVICASCLALEPEQVGQYVVYPRQEHSNTVCNQRRLTDCCRAYVCWRCDNDMNRRPPEGRTCVECGKRGCSMCIDRETDAHARKTEHGRAHLCDSCAHSCRACQSSYAKADMMPNLKRCLRCDGEERAEARAEAKRARKAQQQQGQKKRK